MANRKYTRQDVITHGDGYGRERYPAVCVKCYRFGNRAKLQEVFHCTDTQLETALGFAWETACMQFWENMRLDVAETYAHSGHSVEMYSGGRSDGWLELHGLPDIESWDAILLAKYRHVETACRDEMRYLGSDDYIREMIEANQWTKPDSELYNFVQSKTGQTLCVADINRATAEYRESLLSV